MTPEQHDRLARLPQPSAAAHRQRADARRRRARRRDGLGARGPRAARHHRLARARPHWRDIVATNADNIAPAIDDLIAALAGAEATRRRRNRRRRLEQMFMSAARWKRRARAQLMSAQSRSHVSRDAGSRQRCSRRRCRIRPSASSRSIDCPPSFWRYLYTEVGRAYHWVDRLPWTDDEIRAYLADPAVSLWLMTVAGAPAGYFELRRDRTDGVEIVYFGLLPEFTGRGLGGHMLTRRSSAPGRTAPSVSGCTPTRSITRPRCRTT